jgi:N-methylhydantoinase A
VVSQRVGIDIGGTFTDLVLLDEEAGELTQTKTPSTPSDPSIGAADGIEKLLEEADLAGEDVHRVIHGTTVATNAVIEHDGVDTALVTTEGFRDVLRIGRQARPNLYDFWETPADPLVPRHKRLTVDEKIGPEGEVKTPLIDEEIDRVVSEVEALDVAAVTVCLLHAYANPEHEERLAAAIEADLDGVDAVRSSSILPEYREYERMSTSVINAYVKPLMGEYISRLESRLSDQNVTAPLQIMQSNGGLMTAETASEKSVHTLLSGPSAGVLTGQFISSITDTGNLITFDMGGTSADICTIQGGEPEYSVENELGGHPVRVRMLDINAIGAGGGSIGWIDRGGALRVGPKSAGSDPGPVCYGQGGEEPTVTDANLVLGRLNPNYLLEGELEVEYDRAVAAIEETLADPLDMSVEEAAEGVLDVVTANMIRGIRGVSVERGYDPRESSLVAFGGAGPLHAHQLIEEMDMGEAIVPVTPGVASSFGLLAANTKHSYVRTVLEKLDALTPGELDEAYGSLQAEAGDRLEAEDIDNARSVRLADMKYERQGYEITVTVPDAAFGSGGIEALADVFELEHEREYGFSLGNEPIEIVNLRLQTVAETNPPELRVEERAQTDVESAQVNTREAVFEGNTYGTAIYKRDQLEPGHVVAGPAIIEELSSTTVVGPEQEASVDEYGIIHIERGDR